ncbi:MAG: hypothetical protein HGA31_05490 [Candidatus Moranbacteria bacterium]|nr:hypothetical protein [Candidatus Moranbacteria bacterium]
MEEKVHFVEMAGILERAFGVTHIPSVRDDLDVEPLELFEAYEQEVIGRTFAEDIASKTAFGLSKLPGDPEKPRVSLGTGAIVMCDGKIISELKGDLDAAIAFLREVSGKSCSIHLSVAALSKAIKSESQSFRFRISVRVIPERDILELYAEGPSDQIDFIDLLFRFEKGRDPDMHFLREKHLSAECRFFLGRHVCLVPW